MSHVDMLQLYQIANDGVRDHECDYRLLCDVEVPSKQTRLQFTLVDSYDKKCLILLASAHDGSLTVRVVLSFQRHQLSHSGVRL